MAEWPNAWRGPGRSEKHQTNKLIASHFFSCKIYGNLPFFSKGHYIWSDGSEYFGEFHEALRTDAFFSLDESCVTGEELVLLARATCGAMAKRPGPRVEAMRANGARTTNL